MTLTPRELLVAAEVAVSIEDEEETASVVTVAERQWRTVLPLFASSCAR